MKFILILIMYNQAMTTAEFDDRSACEQALVMSKSLNNNNPTKAVVGFCAPAKTQS